MDTVVLVISREDCKDLLYRFHHVGTTKPFPEVPYSLLITGQGSEEVTDVRYNPTSTLPPALATFARKASEFLCYNNPLITNLANARKEDSAGYFNELKEGTFAVVNLFGKPSVGRTALARTIVSQIKVHEIRVEKTAGIQIEPLQTEEFKFKIFDTAGDADFLETHLLFTSPDNLYLNVLVNLATKGIHGKADIQLGHLVMWLNSIFVRASNSKSVHVCTHADANIPHPSSLKIGIVQKYPTSECGGTPVIKARKRAPVVQARKVFEVAPDTTRKWMDVLEELLRVINQRGKLPVIKKEEARRPAERSGVTDYNKSCLMLNVSASADHTVYHERVPDVVILDPQWLAVELCAPISFNQDWFGDGILKLTDLERASSGDILPEGGLVVHSLCEQLDECFCFFRPGFSLALLIPKMQRNERQEDGGCAGEKTTSAAEGSCWNSKDNALVGELCIKLDD